MSPNKLSSVTFDLSSTFPTSSFHYPSQHHLPNGKIDRSSQNQPNKYSQQLLIIRSPLKRRILHQNDVIILHQEPTSPYKHNLVGGIPTPLKNDGVRQLGSWNSQYLYGKTKKVPNHKPDILLFQLLTIINHRLTID